VTCRCYELVVEAGESSRTLRQGNVRRWEQSPSNGSKDVTVDTSMCITAYSKVQLRAVSKSPINAAINPNSV
jgi:hypothetical protein